MSDKFNHIKRLQLFLILQVLFITVYCNAEIKMIQEQGPKDQPAYRIENQFYKLRLTPGRGGRIDEFSYLSQGGVWPIAKERLEGGLLMDHIEWGWPGELLDAVYKSEVLESTPESVSIKMAYTCQSGLQSGLQIDKVITLKDNSRVITVKVTLSNKGKSSIPAMYWCQSVFHPGPETNINIYFRPSCHGLDIASSKVTKTGPEMTGEDYVHDPFAGWMATVDPDVEAGAVFLMDYNYLSKLYNCRPAYTTEWFGDRVRLPVGETWSTTYCMVPVHGFKSFVHGSERVLADINAEQKDNELSLTHRIAATDKELPAINVIVKVFTVEGEKLVWTGTGSVPPVGHKPFVLQQTATGLPKGHLVVRVELKGKDVEERYELLVAKTSLSLFLNPVRVYQVAKPPKNKVFFKPKEIKLIPHQGHKVLFLKGPYYKFFRLEEALEKIPDTTVKSSWESTSMWSDNTTSYFPSTYEEMLCYDLIILANIDASALPDSDQEMLKDYVEAGGGLLVLGGFYAFGNGSYKDSRFSSILPVQTAGPFDLKPAVMKGRQIQAVNITPVESPLMQGLKWQDEPKVMWYHRVKGVTASASVLAKAGDAPLIIKGSFGKGNTVVILAAPLGKVANNKNQTAFWNWTDWQELMARLVKSLLAESK